ncbi:MAG: hypothetical protein AAB402_03495 [Patescibacteria group bacterium]
MWIPVDAETDQPAVFSDSDWPLLIHGASKSGAAFFTVALTAELIRRGERVVFICAAGEAIRALQSELQLKPSAAHFSRVSRQAAAVLEEMQLVTLLKRRGTDPLTSLRALKDWNQRAVVIVNVEDTLTPQLWAVVKSHRRLILSGDFEKEKIDIDQKIFSSSILFSVSPGHWHRQRSSLPTYIGQVFRGRRSFQTILREVPASCGG